MEIDCSLGPNPRFTGALSRLIHRIRGVRTRESAATAPRLPLTPSPESTDMPGGYRVQVCRRVSVGDSFNDEEWSDDLPSSHVKQPIQRFRPRESTNLSLGENGQEDTRGVVSRKVSSDYQQ